jgi:hypothetical protein
MLTVEVGLVPRERAGVVAKPVIMLTVGVMLTVEVGLVPRERAGVVAKPIVMLTVSTVAQWKVLGKVSRS